MVSIMDRISQIGFVPVVALHDVKKAVGLARALEAGGIPVIEVTYRTAKASDCIRAIHRECPHMLIGAGTVLTISQVQEAVDGGAMFIVSPGYDEKVVSYCLENRIAAIPGVSSATEIQRAVAEGLKVLKIFPVEPLGGISAINFLAAPFSGIQFLPAGGIVMDNLGQYLANEHVFACGGGFVARTNLIEAEDWAGITDLCNKTVQTILGFTFAHVGVNCGTQEKAYDCMKFFKEAFDQPAVEGRSSIFLGDRQKKKKKKPFYGTNGHLGFYTNSVERAIYHLGQRGWDVMKESIRYDSKGGMQSAYLQGEVNGFAVHVVKR